MTETCWHRTTTTEIQESIVLADKNSSFIEHNKYIHLNDLRI